MVKSVSQRIKKGAECNKPNAIAYNVWHGAERGKTNPITSFLWSKSYVNDIEWIFACASDNDDDTTNNTIIKTAFFFLQPSFETPCKKKWVFRLQNKFYTSFFAILIFFSCSSRLYFCSLSLYLPFYAVC